MKTLIINLGPAGDVTRTTLLLRELEGEIYWLTKNNCKDLLNSEKLTKVFFLEKQEDLDILKDLNFDLLINLNEEIEALNIIKEIKHKKLIGFYLNNKNKIDYTSTFSYWYDMSLSSKLGKKEADRLKFENKRSINQISIESIGKSWIGQEYDLGVVPKKGTPKKIGLINLSTGIWKNKQWAYYNDLADLLSKEGYKVEFLGFKPTIMEHIEDINDCELIVCGDTLGMHLALALKKKVVVLFNCTPQNEIYGYNRMKKIVSPLCEKYFLQKTENKEAQNAITLEEVYSVVKQALKTQDNL